MKIVLHLGAHRTANTSFQAYLAENEGPLQNLKVKFWGPGQTRNGHLTGIVPVAENASASAQLQYAQLHLAKQLQQIEASGFETLLISDENMIGASRRNLRQACLYPGSRDRMMRFYEAFEGRIDRVCLSVRSQDTYWASVLAYSVARGHKLPSPQLLAALSQSRQTWRDVVQDLAAGLPGVPIQATMFENFAGVFAAQFKAFTGLTRAPRVHAHKWLNRSPDLRNLRQIVALRGCNAVRLGDGSGRWQPFDPEEAQKLQEAYADDLFWLRAGASGLATLIEEPQSDIKRLEPYQTAMTRGQDYGKENRYMA